METTKKQEVKRPVFSIVVPVRNRWGPRLRNCVNSLTIQTLQPLEIIVADYGSTKEGHEGIMKTLEDFNCTVYYYPTDEIWSLAIARNMGIRRSNFRCKNVAVVDADLVLEPRVVEVLAELHTTTRSYASCFVRMLLPHEDLDGKELKLPQVFANLKEYKYWPSSGWGGLVSAPRSWLFRVRGFDERMKFWGAEDSDLWKRAGIDGMEVYRINDLEEEETEIYHQFHSDSLSNPPELYEGPDEITDEQRKQVMMNKMMRRDGHTVVRNDENWGLWPPSDSRGDEFIYD